MSSFTASTVAFDKLEYKIKIASFVSLSYLWDYHFYGSVMQYVDEILKCVHSNENYWAVISCGTVYYAVQGGSNVWTRSQAVQVKPCKTYSIFFFRQEKFLLAKDGFTLLRVTDKQLKENQSKQLG